MREREGERARERETDRQTDRQSMSERESERERCWCECKVSVEFVEPCWEKLR